MEKRITADRQGQDAVDKRIRELGLGKDFDDFAYGDIRKIELSKDLARQAYRHLMRGEHKEAKQKYERSLKLAEELGYWKQIVNVLASLGSVYMALDCQEKAFDSMSKAVRIASERKDLEGLCQAENNLAVWYRQRGEINKATELYEHSLKVARSINNLGQMGTTLNNLGEMKSHLGFLEEALESYQKALAMCEAATDHRGAGSALFNLGTLFHGRARYNDAISHFEKALKETRKAGSRSMQASIMQAQASVYEELGLYAQARELLQRSGDLWRQIGDTEKQQQVETDSGLMLWRLHEFDKAKTCLETARKVLGELGKPNRRPTIFLIGMLIEEGKLAEAEKYSIDLSRQRNNSGDELSLRLINGQLALRNSRYENALDVFERASVAARKKGSLNILYDALTWKGICYEKLKEYENAAAAFQAAVDMTEELRTSLSESQRRQFFDTGISGLNRTAAYEGLARVSRELGECERALRFSEFTKARALTERLSSLPFSGRRFVPEGLIIKDQRLRERIAGLTNAIRLAREKGNSNLAARFEGQLYEVKEEYEDLKAKMRKDHKDFAAIRFPEPPELNNALIGNEEYILSFDVTEFGLLKFLIKGNELIFSKLDRNSPRKKINTLVQRCRNSLAVGSPDVWKTGNHRFDIRAAEELAQICLGDEILDLLPSKTPLTVIPDDSLGLIPFELLVLKRGSDPKINGMTGYQELPDTRFFGDRNPIRYRQSITEISIMNALSLPKNRSDRMLIVANPIYEKTGPSDVAKEQGTDETTRNPGRLRKTESDTESPYVWIRRIYESVRLFRDNLLGSAYKNIQITQELVERFDKSGKFIVESCTGEKATKKYFETTVIPTLHHFRWIVFGTHGMLQEDYPGLKQPVLVLGLAGPYEYGYLTRQEVSILELNADLVALTACQSGVGRTVSGEGVMSMGAAFRFAGARSVLASLWPVHARASVDLVVELFRLVGDQDRPKTKSVALQMARNAIREKGYDHPWFWASFILTGEDN